MALKEADTANRSNTLVADVMDNNTGVLGMENKTIDGESGEVKIVVVKNSNTFRCVNQYVSFDPNVYCAQTKHRHRCP